MAKANKRKSKKGSGSYLLTIIILIILLVGLVIWGASIYRDYHNKERIANKEKVKNTTPQHNFPKSNPNQPKPKVKTDLPHENSVDQKTNSSTITSNSNKYYYTKAFDFGWPAYDTHDDIIEHAFYTLKYNEQYEQADWVAYTLKKENLIKPKNKRKNNFRPDPKVKTYSAHPNDYKKSGYDRGHLAPSGDFNWSEEAMDATFYMSNMCPQNPDLNRRIWKDLEELTRQWAFEDEILYIVTGPVLKPGLKTIGKNKVAVPEIYYKVILDIKEPEIKAAGFLFYNKKTSKPLADFIVPIDSVEKLTGLNFFPILPDSLEVSLERRAHKKLWFSNLNIPLQ